jgi:hypothetical protein
LECVGAAPVVRIDRQAQPANWHTAWIRCAGGP